MDDLVKRLRDAYPATQDMQHTLQGDLMDEAADAIEALQARVAELERTRIRLLNEKLSGAWRNEIEDNARRDTFEEAAKACEKIEDDYDDGWRKGGKSDSHLEGMSDGANDCASAIRALAEKG